MERCKECGGKLRVVDAPRLLLVCTRCGTKSVGNTDAPDGDSTSGK
jgi:hypothetical protein